MIAAFRHFDRLCFYSGFWAQGQVFQTTRLRQFYNTPKQSFTFQNRGRMPADHGDVSSTSPSERNLFNVFSFRSLSFLQLTHSEFHWTRTPTPLTLGKRDLTEIYTIKMSQNNKLLSNSQQDHGSNRKWWDGEEIMGSKWDFFYILCH